MKKSDMIIIGIVVFSFVLIGVIGMIKIRKQ